MEISTYLSNYIYLFPVCSLLHKWHVKEHFFKSSLFGESAKVIPQWGLCVEATCEVIHLGQGGIAVASDTRGKTESIKM